MLKTRVIPCLLLKNAGLVKTIKFRDPTYVGDPINAVKIFNEKEVDELVFLDITASRENRPPPLKTIANIASECFMPLGYGGGIRALGEIKEILSIGVEKVIINSSAVENPEFIRQAAGHFGSQSIVVSIDVNKNIFGKYSVWTHGGTTNTHLDPVILAKQMASLGAGEILLNVIYKDGTMSGYDVELIKQVTSAVSIPVVACGGAGKASDFSDAVYIGGASAVAAGSMFVFHGKHRAVLINFPTQLELQQVMGLKSKEELALVNG